METDKPTPDATSTSKPQKPPRSRARGCLFRIIALSFPLVLLGIVEGILTLAGAGQNMDLVETVNSPSPAYNAVIREDAELPYFDRHGLAGPEPARFQSPKPQQKFRIVVLGASTVQGFPYDPAIAFPRQLEELLNHQMETERVEVINLGITAINSFSIADMAQRCLVCEPDLIVVYAGHNEFYGPGGVASNAVPVPPTLYRIGLATRRSRTWQVLANLVSPPQQNPDSPLDSLPANLNLARSDSRYATAVKHYRRNLTRIINTCQTNEVPVVLCTVTGNLFDHSPTSQLTPYPEGEEDPKWMKPFNEGRQLASSKVAQYEQALEKLEEAEAINSESALLHFRKGNCLKNLGRLPEAVAAYSLARDIDGCRFRAPSEFAKTVRSLATEHANATLCDIEGLLRASENPLPGQDFFLEHVHPNLHGHRFIATELAKVILPGYLTSEWNSEREWTDEQWRDTIGILKVDELAALSLAVEVMDSETMKQTFDSSVHIEKLLTRIKKRFAECPPEYLDNFADLPTAQMASNLLLYLSEADWSDDRETELTILKAAAKRSRWSADAHIQLAAALEAQGQNEAAAIERQTATELSVAE